MKKVIFQKYGGPEVFEMIEEENKPSIKPTEVLVQVKACSYNPIDKKIRNGELKLLLGSKFPKLVGLDFAGIVDSIGADVTDFAVGDEVFGSISPFAGCGALSEYVAVTPKKQLWHKPSQVSFSQAASIPIVGAAAYDAIHSIRKDLKVADDVPLEILLNGATGGVGMFAIQLAKHHGMHVTAVCGTQGVSYATKWGADVVIDYKTQNVLSMNKQYDAVLDLSVTLSYHDAKNILMKDRSAFYDFSPVPYTIITSFIFNHFTSKLNKMVMSESNEENMTYYVNCIQEKGLDVTIAKTFPFGEFREAYVYAEKGGFIGKVTIEMS